MVKPIKGPKKEPAEVKRNDQVDPTIAELELPDFEAEDDDMGEWRLPNWEVTT